MRNQEDRTTAARRRMVETQIAARGVGDGRVLEAMIRVPRELFVPEHLRERAFDDGPLPIGSGQTISQPYVVALMAEAAGIEPADRVLEIGTGSGYGAAILGHLAERVVSVERHADLAERARARLAEAGCRNVEVVCGDGTLGWPQAAPFDAIVVTAAPPLRPRALVHQLEVGGRLIVPVGADRHSQRLLCLTRTADGGCEEVDLGGVAFVPLVGEEGWGEDEGHGR